MEAEIAQIRTSANEVIGPNLSRRSARRCWTATELVALGMAYATFDDWSTIVKYEKHSVLNIGEIIG